MENITDAILNHGRMTESERDTATVGNMPNSGAPSLHSAYMRLHRLGDENGKTVQKLRAAAVAMQAYIHALVMTGDPQALGVYSYVADQGQRDCFDLPRGYALQGHGLYVCPRGRGYMSVCGDLEVVLLFARDLATGLLPEIEAFVRSQG